MLFQYQKELAVDNIKMDKIAQEKQVIFTNLEEETKQILMSMMQHLKDIKKLRSELADFDK